MAGSSRTVTKSSKGARVFDSNDATDSSFTLSVDTASKPTPSATNGYISTTAGEGSGASHNLCICEFLITDAANETCNFQCYSVVANEFSTNTSMYHHLPMWEVDCTAGTLVTGETSEFYADTIVSSYNASGGTIYSFPSGDFTNSAGRIVFDFLGGEFLHFKVNRNSSAASGNIVVRFI